MQELKCPGCGYLNPDIRELGYPLPWTCGRCPRVWRAQDVLAKQEPIPADMANVLAENLWDLYATDGGKREADFNEALGFSPISDLVELPDGTVMHKDDAK